MAQRQNPPVYIPGATPEDLDEQKRFDQAWAAYDAEIAEAKGEFNKSVEQARVNKRASVDAAYRRYRERHDKALQQVQAKVQTEPRP